MYTIGLLVDYLEMSYTNRIIQGCVRGAKEYGINFIIYPGSALKEEREVSLEQVGTERYSGRTTFHRNVLYEFAKRNHLDGIIVSAQTVGAYLSAEEFEEFLQTFHIPILLLEQKKEGYSSITFADNGIELALRHLIHECGRKRIAYVSGPVNNEDAAARLETYKRVMAEEGLGYKEEWVAYGDFSPFCENAIKELLDSCAAELDAICVANDAMCIPVYRFLKEYGITPGKEIAVTGYDNTDIATDCKPQLTSLNANAETMGYHAISEILKLLSGEEICVRELPVELVIRASTLGDDERPEILKLEMQAEGLHNKRSLKNIYINSIATDMLMYPNDKRAAFNSVAYNLSHAGVDEFYIFLYEKSFVQKKGDMWKLPKYVEKYVSYNERENVSEIGEGNFIATEDIMRQEWETPHPKVMTVFPVEVMGEHYGLIYMSYHTDLCMDVFSIANQFATVLHIYHLISQLRDATEAKSNFLANMSHEIRTPLNAVLGMNEMILRESSEETVVGYASHIARSGKTLLSLINEILDLSKIESGKMEIVPVEYHPVDVLTDLYHMIAPRAEKKELKFEMSVDEKLPSGLYGDDVRIKQIITNLLTNAVKYTPSGSVRFEVACGFEEEGKVSLHISVKDTGIGIRQEDMEKLFANFQRLDEERNRNIEGTGLGMGITIRFLEMMGSRLEVKSIYGEGSEFSFVLKQRITDAVPTGPFCPGFSQEKSEKRMAEKQLVAPDARILVVDDNDMNRVVVGNLLKATKVQLDTLESGYACLDAVKSKEYDLIFLDHMMPDMDGVETMQRLRKYWSESGKKAVPVIILTANAIVGARETYLEKGFDDYISKPIEILKLEHMLAHYLPQDMVREEERKSARKQEKQDMWEAITGIDMYEAMLHNPDKETFLQLLEMFYEGIKTNADEIEIMKRKGQISDFTIRVHALKSTARMIGATVLSDLAKELEEAGNCGDEDKIHADAGLMLELYRKYREFLRPLFAAAETSDEISAEELAESVRIIGEAMQEFNLERADVEMAKIKHMKIPPFLEADFELLKDGVLNFKIEETVALSHDICNKLV